MVLISSDLNIRRCYNQIFRRSIVTINRHIRIQFMHSTQSHHDVTCMPESVQSEVVIIGVALCIIAFLSIIVHGLAVSVLAHVLASGILIVGTNVYECYAVLNGITVRHCTGVTASGQNLVFTVCTSAVRQSQLSFPVQMTSWPVVGQLTAYTDATTGATPLALMKQAIYGDTAALSQIPDALTLLIGQNGGCLGEVSALALLIGLVYMLWKKIITWHIPVSILATVFVFAGIMHLADPEKYVSPVLQLLSGGLMLGAVFMATDYVTSPMSKKGMLIYGVCIGLLTVVIRLFGAYPEGMSFAILIMNAFTPLINTYCKPKRFGEVAKKK